MCTRGTAGMVRRSGDAHVTPEHRSNHGPARLGVVDATIADEVVRLGPIRRKNLGAFKLVTAIELRDVGFHVYRVGPVVELGHGDATDLPARHELILCLRDFRRTAVLKRGITAQDAASEPCQIKLGIHHGKVDPEQHLILAARIRELLPRVQALDIPLRAESGKMLVNILGHVNFWLVIDAKCLEIVHESSFLIHEQEIKLVVQELVHVLECHLCGNIVLQDLYRHFYSLIEMAHATIPRVAIINI
jgi:hypothetical protein